MVTFGTEGRQVLDFGAANAGASPSFLVYSDLNTLTALTQPVVYEIAGGTFYFDVVFPVPGSLTTSSIVARITAGGVSRTLVITPQPINTNTGVIREVVELLVTDTGLEPVFVVYQDTNTQVALTPQPDIIEISSGLYYFEYEFPIESSPATTEIDWVVSAPLANPLSLSPNTGSIAGGDSVTITGTDFRAGATVTFGGDAATVGVITSTTITITTPAHAVGAVDVVVTNVGCPPATLVGAFTYEAPRLTVFGLMIPTGVGAWTFLDITTDVLGGVTIDETYLSGKGFTFNTSWRTLGVLPVIGNDVQFSSLTWNLFAEAADGNTWTKLVADSGYDSGYIRGGDISGNVRTPIVSDTNRASSGVSTDSIYSQGNHVTPPTRAMAWDPDNSVSNTGQFDSLNNWTIGWAGFDVSFSTPPGKPAEGDTLFWAAFIPGFGATESPPQTHFQATRNWAIS